MSPHMVTPPLETDTNARKRVCKACDRCRLKKSKCDGTTPCNRCRTDNAICVFGERKKSHDKIYPKGYVEMLEQQQLQLINGLQEMYRRAASGQGWEGPLLTEHSGGRPLTHDILNSLGVLHQEPNSPSESFEDDLDIIQHRIIGDCQHSVQRQTSEDSDHERESNQSMIYDSDSRKGMMTDPFASQQLPTPPPTQSGFNQNSWQHTIKGSNLRPHLLQLQTTCSTQEQSMDPTMLSRPWLNSTTYGDNGDFLPYDTFSNFNGMASSSLSAIDTTNLGTAPSWNEEDFTSFLNTTLA